MAYIKTNWENGPSKSTPINKDNLNHMEDGIYNNSINIGNLDNLNTETKETVVQAVNEINTKVSIDPSLIFDSTKLELKGTDNKNEITVINNKIVIINLTFSNLVKFTSKTYVDIGNISGMGISPSKNFTYNGIATNDMNVGFGYYQSYSGKLRLKFANDCNIGNEINIHAVYTLD